METSSGDEIQTLRLCKMNSKHRLKSLTWECNCFRISLLQQKFFYAGCHLIFIGLRRQWIKRSLLQCNDTHLDGMLKGWKFIVSFRVWQLAILQMGYPHCNINKLYHGDTEHNRGKRKPLITHQKAAFVTKVQIILVTYKFIFVYTCYYLCDPKRKMCAAMFVKCL